MNETPTPSTGQKRSWSDLMPRLLSAAVLVPLVAVALYLGGVWLAILAGLAFAGVYREWDTMVAVEQPGLTANLLSAIVGLEPVFFALWGLWPAALLLAGGAVLVLLLGGGARIWRLAGLVGIAMVTLALISIRGEGMAGLYAALFLCVAVWLTDSAAFFAGRQIGGAKLSPDISPSKTWSGALGGLAMGVAGGFIVWLWSGGTPWWGGIVFAAVLSISGQLGDLGESALKRRFKIKDSGDIIPGHGGLMDRLDSLTLAAIVWFLIGVLHGSAGAEAADLLSW